VGRVLPLVLALGALAAGLAAWSATPARSDDGVAPRNGVEPRVVSPRPDAVRTAPVSNPLPTPRPRADKRFLIARVRAGRSVTVRARPGGAVLARLGAQTEFGSRRALSVVRVRRGRWLAVTAPELGNGRLGWVDAREGSVAYARTPLRIDVDLSARRLVLRAGGRVLRRMTVSVGRPGSATPTGRFAVTDKLAGSRYSSYYGCCILALSGRQPNLPPGWTGGDRLAIHGTPGNAVGRAASAGCLHATEADLRALMRSVPLGTPVVISP
jgi:lipoprotein-anchoring transpeptidase ErfK/SrfK